MRKKTSSGLTRKQNAELEKLARMADDEIDTKDIPEVRDWSGAKRGLFYRPVKQQITLRLDADLVSWFKSHARRGKGYQTDMNSALREYVVQRKRKSA
ncbi:MAG: BrnA antitoxin family protein [Stellaceae bacterium]